MLFCFEFSFIDPLTEAKTERQLQKKKEKKRLVLENERKQV